MRIEQVSPELVVHVDSEPETDQLGRILAGLLVPNTVVGLIGPLGAGKTRLARSIAEAMGVDPRAIGSPTFGLIHEYDGTRTIFHFDTYRLDSPAAFDDLGAEDYWSAGGICLVEWADRVRDRLPPDAWIIGIKPLAEGRAFSMTLPEDVAQALILRLGPGSC